MKGNDHVLCFGDFENPDECVEIATELPRVTPTGVGRFLECQIVRFWHPIIVLFSVMYRYGRPWNQKSSNHSSQRMLIENIYYSTAIPTMKYR